ncbi:glycosyltransferase [uncultured Desulfosarcina sp.]|uniref:glycosyltransferase n=1 Tax=uncultured Desulfosarcina sp. TaxID=218289 RepID=UPI0029C66AA3|nr:glycosyltransferase [uncultured Desulfosarcina sp.]
MFNQPQEHRSLESVWQRIDRIYCISLVERADRQAGARDQFARVGLDEQVSFFPARRHPRDCEQGIFESHQACLKMGLAAGARHMLMFEDDVVFGKIDAPRLEKNIEFFINTEACKILFLGCLTRGSRATETPGIRRIRYRCLAHAYLIKPSLARQMADAPWQKVPYDIMLRNFIDDAFVVYPSIAFQSNSPSDNSRHRALDTLRRLFGGLRIIQTVNEHYHRFRYAVIATHLLVIGAAILWILT